MKKAILLTVFAFAAVSTFAQSKKVGVFRFSEKAGKHTAELMFRTGAFEPSKHTITYGKRLDLTILEVDGRTALGVDGNVPRVEIQSVAFYFDGKKVAVPRRLYADLYEPTLEKDSFATKIGDEGSSLLVFMAGGDAAGGYQVIWVLRKDGVHSRFSSPCSDCNYSGFLGFFIDQFAR
jgi:hypothetical protein